VKKSELETVTLRIIAGHLRSRKIQFACDRRTRPMKDRTREAVMNLMGGTIKGMLAFDLFGGSGVLAFESISRGASRAVIWEILRQGATTIERIASELGIRDQVLVLPTDVFRWTEDIGENLQKIGIPTSAKPDEATSPPPPWMIFCCPPYAFWESEGAALMTLVSTWYEASPKGSLIAVELEAKTPDDALPSGPDWDIRIYSPAKIAIAEKA
jgi:16S rRNA (guanine966-N2)-methyltransferase